ncbi:LacI family DNA-binding transcriptional regulator [Microlunatus parietis]|uniref:LacI family transcriptional regulator n=1 Tax=Microlunatus parietis TaxID=682979 RepID=A0A7Y9IDI8_9ACTN|nr:LacI family DNA-binding transcriptional regulator [Microlunatus parietis]NYE74966.1 LacI family transcriptional regulator [Microlunatus parietis]
MSAIALRDVAARARVSPGTVSNFLNHPHKVAPATAARISSAIEDLGYVGNHAARQLRVGASTTIGHVTFEVGNHSFSEFSAGVAERAREVGYTVLIGSDGGTAEGEAAHLDLFESQRVRGLLLSPVGAFPKQRIEHLRERGIPTVIVGARADTDTCSSVSFDEVAGGDLAAGHLVEAGRRRLLFVGGPLGIETVADRLVGARQAVERCPAAALEVVEVDARTVAAGRAVGHAIGQRPAADRPDGIFAANDALAFGIMHGLREVSDIVVPNDIAIVGYDDTDFGAGALVPLTSIARSGQQYGRTAMDLLHTDISRGGPHSRVVFQPQLVVRGSSVLP